MSVLINIHNALTEGKYYVSVTNIHNALTEGKYYVSVN